MGTIIDIVQFFTVRTTKNINTSLKNITERIISIKNACTVSRRVIKKNSSGRNKNMAKKENLKLLMLLNI